MVSAARPWRRETAEGGNTMSDGSGVRRRFVKAAMDAPFLQRDEELLLAQRWRNLDDQAALHRLAQSHMRLVIAIAARFRHYGLSMADLVQEGHIGLLEAAARFEPDREVRFSTYATWWIRASIQDYILRNWSIVRGGTSSAQKALFFNLRRLRARLTRESGERGADELYREIATAVGVSVKDVAIMDSRLSAPDASLNAPMSDGEDAGTASRVSFLVDDKPLPDEVVEASIDGERLSSWLRGALDVLNERELNIVRARRLVDDAATLESLGETLGISKERVRQIENRALDKLRRALIDSHPEAQYAMA
jgi:RNA polymerase sigma-32 factor